MVITTEEPHWLSLQKGYSLYFKRALLVIIPKGVYWLSIQNGHIGYILKGPNWLSLQKGLIDFQSKGALLAIIPKRLYLLYFIRTSLIDYWLSFQKGLIANYSKKGHIEQCHDK